jgi:glucose 1-dehydrogenase
MNGRCVVELRLDGKLALVTGGDSGIGRAIAMRMAASGADVAITYFTDREGAERTAHEIQEFARRSFVAQCDVGESREVEHLFTALDTDFGPVDILVNSAGIYHHSMIAEMPDAIWDRVLKTNLYGPFYCSRAVVTRMLARGIPGRIINISSVHEEACGVGGGAYNVSKSGLRNLTRTLAHEVAPNGITVNGIAPGMILTPMNQQAVQDEAFLAFAEEQIPARRAGLPDDVAALALFLASEQASYCTGSTHYVDGGWMLAWPPV